MPLHLALAYSNVDCVKLLVDNGADKNAKSHEDVASVPMTAVKNRHDIVSYLLDANADGMTLSDESRLPIHSACKFGSVEVAELLFERYPHALNIQASNTGATPLHEAAISGSVSCMEMLLKKGADTTIVDNKGKCTLDIAEELAAPPLFCSTHLRRTQREFVNN